MTVSNEIERLRAEVFWLREQLKELRGDPAMLQSRFNLTAKEAEVLAVLVAARGAAVKGSAIFNAIYPIESDTDPKVIDVYITKLRKKLPAATIDTTLGVGYRVTEAFLRTLEPR